jgi:putative two-component system response regulator
LGEEEVYADMGTTYDVRIVFDQQSVLKLCLQSEMPRVVLLDARLPLDIVKSITLQIKGEFKIASVPVLVYGTRFNDILGELYSYGINMHLDLPLPSFVISNIIKSYLIQNSHVHLISQIANSQDIMLKVIDKNSVDIQDGLISGLGSIVYERTNRQKNKLKRMKLYVRYISDYLRCNREYAIELNDESVELICSAIALYDIGMISVPESIIYKSSNLTSEEMHIVKEHCNVGKLVLEREMENMAYQSKFFAIADDLVLYHHEKWNGTGYPKGIAGNKIPLTARILSLCDSYDAIVRVTAYSASCTHIEAVELMVKEREQHFDPAILDAFLAIHVKFHEVASMYPN